jgi:hypothetical protein
MKFSRLIVKRLLCNFIECSNLCHPQQSLPCTSNQMLEGVTVDVLINHDVQLAATSAGRHVARSWPPQCILQQLQ